MGEVLYSAMEFFNLPSEEKLKFMSSDVYKPARYGTRLRDGADKIQFWRVFLKHYASPLEDKNPPKHRCAQVPANPTSAKHGRDAGFVRGDPHLNWQDAFWGVWALQEQIRAGLVKAQSGQYLAKSGLGHDIVVSEPGSTCPLERCCLTIVLQSSEGLEFLGKEDESWRKVPNVHVGDHLEVLSNGIYKSVVHRATLNRERIRISITSLHSLGVGVKMETAKELVDEQLLGLYALLKYINLFSN
ncbi:Fe2OG dioxygenase domain-containing protein [Citrus sinensis]|nr:Fe2OG dioxygenase domain-containing protein [Citrus sinensis]